MEKALQKITNSLKKPAVSITVGYFALQLCMVVLVYYWRVFYDYRGSALKLTLLCCLLSTAIYGAVCLLIWRVKDFATRVAGIILICGIAFCFANPPLQVPDETVHYQRSYAISMGRFDFDYDRGYPADVMAFLRSFPGAWTNTITSYWVELEPNTQEITKAGSSANHPIKVRGNHREWMGLQFEEYQRQKHLPQESGNEPIMFQILPFLPQAIGIFIARLFGGDALICLYAGRIMNLLGYTALCWLALKNCKRYQTVFTGMMLLPLSVYLAASLSYDAMLLGLYYLTASYYCKDEIKKWDCIVFLIAFVLMNAVKPWISLLWLALPLVLPKKAWKTSIKKWQLALAGLGSALAVTFFVEWYGTAMRFNYPEIGRMLGSDVVNGGQQLGFVLKNIPRTIAVFLGSLYENVLYLGQLGTFGALDLELPVVQLFSIIALLLATALAVHEKSSLTPRSALGLGLLALCYMGAVMGALYITYTPVAMVRVIGVQARYMLPSFLMFFILLAALLSHVLEPKLAGTAKAENLTLTVSGTVAIISAVLLAQHYFIGPAYYMP